MEKRHDVSDLEDQRQPRKRRARGGIKLIPALYKAVVKDLAQADPAGPDSAASSIDQKDLKRIQKCLDRANHPSTPEAEARAAFHLASLLMSCYNVTQAAVLAHKTTEEQATYAGQSEVSINRADGSLKSVNQQGWVTFLARAMMILFQCKSYSTGRFASVDWTFYGIADNTIAAAVGFEVAYNLIMEWARSRKGVATRNSYCLGAAKGLLRMAEKDKRDEKRKAVAAEHEALASRVKQEEIQKQAELTRLDPAPSDSNIALHDTPTDYTPVDQRDSSIDFEEEEDSVDARSNQEEYEDEDEGGIFNGAPDFKVEADDDQISPFGDLDEEIMKRVKPEPAPSEHNLSDLDLGETNEVEHLWTSSTQLTIFRATANRIADDYVKEKGTKLRSSAPVRSRVRDWSAYKDGKRDAKKIDIRQKRIGH